MPDGLVRYLGSRNGVGVMKDEEKTKEQLLEELGDLRRRIFELEQEPPESREATEGVDIWQDAIPPTGRLDDDITETIDLTTFLTKEVTSSGSFDIRGDIWKTTFGKLLRALPMPALLIDSSHSILFLNPAWAQISPTYQSLQGMPFTGLLSSPSSAEKARSLVDWIFSTRKSKVAQAMLKIDSSMTWCQMAFRPIRIMKERFILVLADDLTRERKEIESRKRAEEALRASEELLAAVLDALPDVVGVQLPDYTATRYNRAGYELLGLRPDEVYGRKCYDLIGRSEPCQPCAITLALKSKNLEHLEKYVPQLDRHFWCSSNPLLDRNGQVKLVVKRLLDITDRRKAEEALRKSETKYRFLAEHASDVLWTLDLNMRTTYVSPSIERIVGFTPSEWMQQDVRDQLTPESFAIAQNRLVEELRRDGEEGIGPDEYAVLELDYLHKDGSVVCLESVMTFIRDESGKPIGIHGLSRDITERRKSEEALRGSEEFNRRLVEHAPFGIAYLSGDGTIEYLNPAASRMAGIPEGQISPVLGQNIFELPGIQNPSEVNRDFERLLKGESLSDLEVPYLSSTGRDIVMLLAATPRFGTDGAVTGAVLMVTDIANRKKAEELLLKTTRLKAVADLAAGVAHTFNNLLQIVIGRLELALVDLEAGNYAVVKDDLERVLESSRSGAEVVRRLQISSREREPFHVSETGVFDLSDVAKQALEVGRSWLTTAEKEGRRISLHSRLKERCFVNADEQEILGVVVNIVRNAVEALPAGGDVDLSTEVEGTQVVLKVRDTGIGMSKEDVGRVFDPFFTTKAEPGAGLSLSSGRKIIEDCGGHILVDSVEGQGTTFTVLFPLAEEPPEPTKDLPERDRGEQLTILVIDDMEGITDLMKSALTADGHAVLTALSGEEGIEIFEDNPADVVICDLGMPGMNGWEVGKRISAICQGQGVPKTPFILLTGWPGQETETEKIADSGVDFVVGKPLRIRDIREVIQKVVEKSRP